VLYALGNSHCTDSHSATVKSFLSTCPPFRHSRDLGAEPDGSVVPRACRPRKFCYTQARFAAVG